jgi:TPR repeat protein
MVESTQKPLTELTVPELENLTEGELEATITANGANANDARLVLGRQYIEGTGKFPKNVKKGFNWVKEAGKNGHIGALEYRVYYEIRFDKQPNMKKLQDNLQKVVD